MTKKKSVLKADYVGSYNPTTKKFDQDLKDILLEYDIGLPLTFMFNNFQGIFGDIYEKPEIKEMFLSFMQELMEDGVLKIADDGKFLEGTIEQQIDKFRQAWPEAYDEDDPMKDIDNAWWFFGAPGGAVWVYPDGSLGWT